VKRSPIQHFLRTGLRAALITMSAIAILLPDARSDRLHLALGLLYLLEAGMFLHHAWQAGLLRSFPRALYGRFKTSGQSRPPLASLALWLGFIAVATIRW